MQYLRIVLNSSIHLENVIEDALDISRLENNKFSLVIQPENIGDIMQEVMEVMLFQVEQKGLQLIISLDQSVP